MQHSPQMTNISPPFPPQNITTGQIQQLLDENKKLILAILDNQNLGKFSDCAVLQSQLQKNLMFLAAIADAQPPGATGPVQVPPHFSTQQDHNMQYPSQTATAQQQWGGFPKFSAAEFQDQQLPQQPPQFQQQQAIRGLVGMGPGGIAAMHNVMQTEPVSASLQWKMVGVQGSKQDGSEAASSDGQGMLGFGQYSRGREP